MKRFLAFLLTIALLLTAAACGNKPAATPPTEPAAPTTINITVKNASSYIFNELYISPTAANEWGEDHLGSTSILKSNGSFDIKLKKYDFENYDIRVVDQDNDVYQFTYVPLREGTMVEISFDDGLIATLTHSNGESAVVSGNLNGEAGGQDATQELSIYAEDFAFTIYNESPYDIYAAYMSPETEPESQVDVLPTVLSAGESQEVTGNVAGTRFEGVANWYLYVVDVDGDVSASVEAFDPWLVNYVDIQWSSSAGGYVCGFNY